MAPINPGHFKGFGANSELAVKGSPDTDLGKIVSE
jgi:hypothetical protein